MDGKALFRAGLYGAAAFGLRSLYQSHKAQVAATQLDRRPSFPTFTMKRYSRPSSRSAPKRSKSMVLYRAPRFNSGYRYIKRTTALANASIPAAGFFVGGTNSIKLNQVLTSDVVGAYDLYRIKKVQVVFCPAVDPGNSGVANNSQIKIDCACDPTNTVLPGASTIVTSYENHRSGYMLSGKPFAYTFYPKVANTVDNAGVATAAGSYATNPWLQLTTAGIDIPHRQLLFTMATSIAPTAALVVNVYYVIHFEVKNQR